MKKPMRLAAATIYTVCFALFGAQSHADHLVVQNYPDYSDAREVYQQARDALKQKKIEEYNRLRGELDEYPLTPYLDQRLFLTQFRPGLDDVAFNALFQDVERWLDEHKDEYAARSLRNHWLNYLATSGRWETFDQFYRADEATLSNQCFAARSLIEQHSDTPNMDWQPVEALWLNGKSLPDSCDKVFDHWRDAKKIAPELAWQRFQLAWNARQWQLAKYLKRYLSNPDKRLATKLLAFGKNKGFWLKQVRKDELEHFSSATQKNIINRLLKSHLDKTATALAKAELQQMTPEHRTQLIRLAAWYMAQDSADQALAWLQTVEGPTTQRVLTFQLRLAVQAKDWPQYRVTYNALDADAQSKPEWRYWYAQAIKTDGQESLPSAGTHTDILSNLADERNFWGFLSAQETGQSHDHPELLLDQQVNVSEDVVKALMPAVELYKLDIPITAEREWDFATTNFDEHELKQAALIASHYGMHNKTFQALAAVGAWDAIQQRFPLVYHDSFMAHSEKHEINPYWMLAMARQESAFSKDARSPAGARGVLQLLPSTAKQMARKLKMPFSRNKLYQADYNIALGSQYLKDLLDKFDNNYILATAAYNAGPYRVQQWLETRPIGTDWVHWVSGIPYAETRKYVINIITYSLIYQSMTQSTDYSLVDFVALSPNPES